MADLFITSGFAVQTAERLKARLTDFAEHFFPFCERTQLRRRVKPLPTHPAFFL